MGLSEYVYVMASTSGRTTYLGYEITAAVANAVAERFLAVNDHVQQIDDVVQDDDGEWEVHFTQLSEVTDDPLQRANKEIYQSKLRVKNILRKSSSWRGFSRRNAC